MTAIACTVGGKNHCLAIQYPFGTYIVVATLGEVVYLAIARSIDQRHILIVPTSKAYVIGKQPTTVRTPLEPLVAIAVTVFILAIHSGNHLLCSEVDDAQCSAVLQESYLLTIRTIIGLERRYLGIGETLFLNVGSIGEEFLVSLAQLGLIDLPIAIALSCINQRTAIRSEVYATLLLRGIGNALGGLVLNRGHIHIAMHDESHFLAIR